MRICADLPGEIIVMIDAQATQDGHDNRSAVIRKALNAFFADSPGKIIEIKDPPSNGTGVSALVGVELSDEMIEMIDTQAKTDGHKNRSAVIRKALNYFFAREVAFVAFENKETVHA